MTVKTNRFRAVIKLQYFMNLSLTVHALSCQQIKIIDENDTVRRYLAESNKNAL